MGVGAEAAWVYVSDNWYAGREFPLAAVTWIDDAGAVPFLRLKLRSSPEQFVAEPEFTLDAILAGDFDGDLRAWFAGAAAWGGPLLVEYGTEVNGDWFSWNGAWNGANETGGYGDPGVPDGPERFVAAYRHLVSLAREEGADNIAWVFHVNGEDAPDAAEAPWNAMENYYPGADVVDVLAVSVYGPQIPQDRGEFDVLATLDDACARLAALDPGAPIVVAEFGATAGAETDQAEWARSALEAMLSGRWPDLLGFSWWNETWQNDDDPAHNTDMRVQANAALAAVFAELVPGNVSERLETGPGAGPDSADPDSANLDSANLDSANLDSGAPQR